MGKLTIICLALLAGCSIETPPMPAATSLAVTKQLWCDLNQPRRPSKPVVLAMTRPELDDLNAYNAKGAAWCGWKP